MAALPEVQKYRNRNGVVFEICIERASKVPGANYWGYLLRVSELNGTTTKHRTYRALLKKQYFTLEEGAAQFVTGDPVSHLKHAYLDHYENGVTPVLWPDSSGEWVVF